MTLSSLIVWNNPVSFPLNLELEERSSNGQNPINKKSNPQGKDCFLDLGKKGLNSTPLSNHKLFAFYSPLRYSLQNIRIAARHSSLFQDQDVIHKSRHQLLP